MQLVCGAGAGRTLRMSDFKAACCSNRAKTFNEACIKTTRVSASATEKIKNTTAAGNRPLKQNNNIAKPLKILNVIFLRARAIVRAKKKITTKFETKKKAKKKQRVICITHDLLSR